MSHCRFSHPNVVRLLGVCTRMEPVWTVMEYMLYGDLKTYLLARCTAPHCRELHCAALHCTALHCTAPHCTVLHHTAPHCTSLHSTALQCNALSRRHLVNDRDREELDEVSSKRLTCMARDIGG